MTRHVRAFGIALLVTGITAILVLLVGRALVGAVFGVPEVRSAEDTPLELLVRGITLPIVIPVVSVLAGLVFLRRRVQTRWWPLLDLAFVASAVVLLVVMTMVGLWLEGEGP